MLIFDLAFAALLVCLGHHRHVRPPEIVRSLCHRVFGIPIFEESLRVDPSEHFLGLRLNTYVASVLALAGVIWFLRTQRSRPAATPAAAVDALPAQRPATGQGRSAL